MVNSSNHKLIIVQISSALSLNIVVILFQIIANTFPWAAVTISAWYYSLAIVSFFKDNEIINSILLSSLGLMIYVVFMAKAFYDFHVLIIIACCFILITRRTYNFKVFLAFVLIDIIWANTWVYRPFGIPLTIATLINLILFIILEIYQKKRIGVV